MDTESTSSRIGDDEVLLLHSASAFGIPRSSHSDLSSGHRCRMCESIAPSEPSPWQPDEKTTFAGHVFSIKCLAMIAFVLAVFLFSTALFLPTLFNSILEDAVRKSLVVDSPDAAGFEDFVSTSHASDKVLISVFLFNVTNPDEIVEGAKPILEEIGPFVYEVRVDRYNITWEQEGEIVSSMAWQRYVPVPERSIANASATIVTTSNFPFLAVYHLIVKHLPSFLRKAALSFVYKQASDRSLFVNLSVNDLLFGYHDDHLPKVPPTNPSSSLDLMRELKLFTNSSEAFRNDLDDEQVEKTLLKAIKLSSEVNNYPGLLPNASTFEEFQATVKPNAMHTGKYIRTLLHAMYKVAGSDHVTTCVAVSCPPGKEVPVWATQEANLVEGSDGEYFPVEKIRKREPVPLWLQGMQTRVFLQPIASDGSEVVRVENIETVRYSLPASAFYNSTLDPSHADYYMNGKCGLFNFSKMAKTTPLFVSKAHFLDADEELIYAVDGVSPPQRDIHDVFVHLHEGTGIPIRSYERLQFNVDIGPLEMGRNGPMLSKVPSTLLPIFWMEIAEQLSDKHKDMFRQCDWAIKMVSDVHIVSYILGSIAILSAIVGSMVHTKKVTEKELIRRTSSYYQALLTETGDQSPFFRNNWIDRDQAFKHPHLLKAIFFTTLTAFTINMVVALINFRNVDHLNLVEGNGNGNPSVLVQTILTVCLVAFFVSLGACADAKKSVELGYFPTLKWDALENVSRGQTGRDFWLVFLYPTVRVNRYILIALINAFWYGILFGPIPITVILLLRYCAGVHKMGVLWFAFIKAAFAGLEACFVFIPVYLKVVSSQVAPLHEYIAYMHEPPNGFGPNNMPRRNSTEV